MRRGALLAALLLAGCVAATPREDVEPPVLPLDHDHRDPSLHREAHGLVEAGFLPIADALGGERARLSDVQVHGDLASVTVNGGAGGFVLVDVGDPAAPRVLGRYRSGTDDNWYTKFTPDGRYVLLTANAAVTRPPTPSSLAGAQAGTAARGLQVVDVADPARPALVGHLPEPVRVINAFVVDDPGGLLVFASLSEDRLQVALPEALEPERLGVYRLDVSRRPVVFEEVGRWIPPRQPGGTTLVHDLHVETHPITGRRILYAAAWDAGAFLLDVTDPTRPVELARFRPSDAQPAGLQVHTVKPHPGLLDGRHLTLVAPETFGGQPSGRYHLLDTTDPARPRALASWTLPGEPTNTEPLLWSPHEFTLAGGRAYASGFHGGVWVLDLSGGAIAPVAWWARADHPPGTAARWAVDVETAVWHEGHVLAVDMGVGLLVLREDAGL